MPPTKMPNIDEIPTTPCSAVVNPHSVDKCTIATPMIDNT